jgi:hypothetical protein
MFFGSLRIVLGVNRDRALDKTNAGEDERESERRTLTPRTIRREPKNIINKINNLCGGERFVGIKYIVRKIGAHNVLAKTKSLKPSCFASELRMNFLHESRLENGLVWYSS